MNCQRDINDIHRLVAEQERRAEIQAAMEAAVSEFNEACVRFSSAWRELESIAKKYDIRIVERNLQVPQEAVFKQGKTCYEASVLRLLK